MSNVQTQVDLRTAFQARLPGVHLRTLEESRAILSLRGAVKSLEDWREANPDQAIQPRVLWKWSAVSGLTELAVTGNDAGQYLDVSKQNPCGLDEALALTKESNNNVVLALMDPWDDLKQAINQRALREALEDARGSGKCIVLVGRDWQIPVELQKDILICDLVLPSYDELLEQISSLATLYTENLGSKVKIDAKFVPALARACTGLTLDEAKSIVALSMIRYRGIGKEAVKMAIKEKSQIVARTGILEFEEPQRGMADVGGLGNLKTWIGKRAKLFSDEAKKAGIKAPKGVLFCGVPGGGKTLCGRAIAAAWNCALVRLDAGKLFGSLVGESESNLRTALRTAEAVAPCVLLIDEIEKGFGQGGGLDGGTSQRVFGALLTWMQDKTAEVFVVGTANVIEKLDSALIRRFDAVFGVDLPDEAARAEIIAIHFRRAGHEIKPESLKALALASNEFTGSELENAVQAALIGAFNDGRKPGAEDIGLAIKATVPLSKTMANDIKSLRELCTSGRAIPAGGSLEADKARKAAAPKLVQI